MSTDDQSETRQIEECREHLDSNYSDVTDVDVYADVISGASDGGGGEYRQLLDEIETGRYAVVVVHEISRLSRVGPTEIHEFIQHCLENDTGVESLDVGLSIRVDDPALQQTVYTMVANIMGDLAKIEHQQKMNRIQSGIRAAQDAGKWTGRAPRGFEIGDDKRLHVDLEEYLNTRRALERIAAGESASVVADDSGIPRTTLVTLFEDTDRRKMYLATESDDDRVDSALEEVRPLEEIDVGAEELDDRIRKIVNEEMEGEK